MDFLVTYDIADTQGEGALRLKRVAQICEKYGERVQLSVFECRQSPSRMTRMVGEIQDVMDQALDSLIVYRFNGGIDDARLRFGRAQAHRLGDPWII